tara:strand:+ start:288 stop:560 length:273 start_codon:yes stop_codon:yes gene_type:complete
MNKEDSITDFLDRYFSNSEEFELLSKEEQAKVYKTYTTILAAIYQVLTFQNVTPLIFAKDAQSGARIMRVLESYSELLPDILRIEVIVVN